MDREYNKEANKQRNQLNFTETVDVGGKQHGEAEGINSPAINGTSGFWSQLCTYLLADLGEKHLSSLYFGSSLLKHRFGPEIWT